MTSLSKIATSYKNKKIEATKNRQQSEKKLKSALSLKRRSSSGLSSLERRKEQTSEKKESISQILNQYMAQRDSVQRLKLAAEARLKQEEEAKERALQESEFSESPDDKARASERVKMIDDKMAELRSEIKQRNAAEERLVKLIADTEKSKSRLDSQIRQQSHARPLLLEQLKSSTKSGVVLHSQVQTRLKQEAQASRNLIKVMERLKILEAKKRKARRKAKKVKKKTKTRKIKTKRKSKTKRIKTKRKSKTKRTKAKTRTKKASKRKSKSKKAKRSKSRRK